MKLLIILYILQCFIVFMGLISGGIERKQEVIYGLLPFYWIWWLIETSGKIIVKRWKELK